MFVVSKAMTKHFVTGLILSALISCQNPSRRHSDTESIVIARKERLQCKQDGTDYVITNKESKAVGEAIKEEQCTAALSAQREDVVCAKYKEKWYPTHVTSLKRIGPGSSYDDCLLANHNATFELICTPDKEGKWLPTHVASASTIGRYGTSLDDCVILTANASKGIVCTNTGTHDGKGRKPTIYSDKPFTEDNLLGASGQQEFCILASRHVCKDFVCVCNGDDNCGKDGWRKLNIKTKVGSGPDLLDIDACIKSLNE